MLTEKRFVNMFGSLFFIILELSRDLLLKLFLNVLLFGWFCDLLLEQFHLRVFGLF